MHERRNESEAIRAALVEAGLRRRKRAALAEEVRRQRSVDEALELVLGL